MKKISHIFLLLAFAASLCSCKQAQLKRVRVAPQLPLVKVDTVRSGITVSQKHYVGNVEASKEALVNAPHGGTLAEVCVKKGQKVKAGQLLARISSQSVQSAYDAAKATMNQAKDAYARAEKLFASGSIAEVKMVEIKTKLAQAESSLNAARNALDECEVRAPFAGEIQEISCNKGERVTIAQPLFSIVDGGELEVVISVPESEIYTLKTGDSAWVSVPALDCRFQARVKSRAAVGNSLSHAYKCTLSIFDAPKDLLGGMVCKVFMDSDNLSGVVIPADAVKVDNEGRYVWTVEDDIVSKVRVEIGGYRGKGVVVSSGLDQGDLLIVEGASKVSTGMKVRLQ